MKANYEFENLGGSPRDDYNDPIKTMFGKNLEDNLPREAIQNSLDACLNKKKPVIVKFKLEKWSEKDIPHSKSFEEILQACSSDKKSKEHFKKALKILKGGSIPVLILSDFNTTGLTGADDDESSKFYKFFKSVGGSGAEKDDGMGGSYGYGKGANISGSGLDTFFATSWFEEKGKINALFMGSLRLVSHTIKGVSKRGIGSYGLPGQKPVRNLKDIPDKFNLRKGESGTDIFIIGLKNHDEWQEYITRSVLKNFWLAIYEEKLVVEIGTKKINKATLSNHLKEAFDSKSKKLFYENPIPYFDAYINGKKISERLPTLGTVSFHYKISNESDMSTFHVACFRKNLMLIQAKSFSSIIPYTGLFVCLDEEGNKILRKMEPPNHKEWSKDELHAQDEEGNTLPECLKADREYKAFIRNQIKSLYEQNPKASLTIESLEDFITLSDDSSGSKASQGDKNESKEETADIKPKSHSFEAPVLKRETKKTKIVPGSSDDGKVPIEKGEGGSFGEGGDGDDPFAGTKGGHGQVGGGETAAKVLGHTSRYYAEEVEGKAIHNLIIRTLPNKKVLLKLQEAGDDDLSPLIVTKVSSTGKIDKHGHIADLVTDSSGEVKVCFEIESKIKPSLKINLYEI